MPIYYNCLPTQDLINNDSQAYLKSLFCTFCILFDINLVRLSKFNAIRKLPNLLTQVQFGYSIIFSFIFLQF